MSRPIPADVSVATVTIRGLGQIALAACDDGLVGIAFVDEGEKVPWHGERRRSPIIDQASDELTRYAAGSLQTFSVKVDLGAIAGFTRRVLDELRHIPFASTVTYAGLATRAGSPRAARAVGQAMARNPVPIVIPCHRVMATGGIGGYSPGLAVKRRLMVIEGIAEP